MPRLDKYHEAVRNALIKDGWTITDDPFTIDFEDATLFADLAAERTIAAQKDNEKIAIEIKMSAVNRRMMIWKKPLDSIRSFSLSRHRPRSRSTAVDQTAQWTATSRR